MPLGAGELLLLLLLGFIAFGPRRKHPAPTSVAQHIATGLAVAAPALVMMDLAGTRLGLGLEQRVGLAAAAALSTAIALFLIALARRYLNRS